MDILTLLLESSPAMVVTVFAVYLLKVFLEKRIEGLAGRFEEIARTSLEIKKELRGEERQELVEFRVAVEEWEDFLQTVLFDFSMRPPSQAQVEELYKADKEVFLRVKKSVVKVGIYLRDQALEQHLMQTVIGLRKMYYPLIHEPLPRIIDLQARLLPIEHKLAAYQESGFADASVAPTLQDRDEHAELQSRLTEEMQKFSDNLLGGYRAVAEQLVALKAAINQYIYRPIESTAIDKD